MDKKIIVQNTMLFLFVLILFPFPKIFEEILIGSIFTICFILCFLASQKCVEHVCEIFSYTIPALPIVLLILQIHSVRFSLVANNIREQLLCVQLYKWLTDKLPNTESFLIEFLVYFWLLLYFLILFLENGVKRIENDKLLKTKSLNEDIAFEIKKIRNYLVGSLVVCLCHFGSGMVKDMMFGKLCFEESFFNNAVIVVGSTIPFVCIYLMMTKFLLWEGRKQ